MSKEGVIKNAKEDFEAIKKYAKEEAMKEVQKIIQPKLNEMFDKKLDESITVDADNASITIDATSIEVNKGDSKIVVDINDAPASEDAASFDDTIPTDDGEEVEDGEEEFEIANPSEPIEEEDMIFEIETPVPAPDMEAEPAVEEPVKTDAVANPFQAIMDKLEGIEKKLESGANPSKAEGEVEIIDDTEAQVQPAETGELPVDAEPTVEPQPEDELPMPAASIPAAVPSAPMIKEFNLQEYENMEETNTTNDIVKEIMSQLKESGYEFESETPVDETMYEMKMAFEDDASSDEDMEDVVDMSDDASEDNGDMEVIITLSDEDGDKSFECSAPSEDSEEFEIVSDEDGEEPEMIDSNEENSGEEEIDEMLGLGLGHGSGLRHSPKGRIPNVPHKEKFQDDHNLQEIKAQYESKLDELVKENNSLKKDIREFEESFVELRNSIDEMQTFNAKLALANKLFLNGGLSTEEKVSVNESLDKASSVKEAEKIYQKIVKENKITVKDNNIANKIKSRTTNVASSQPLYESKETKVLKEETLRSQILAGIRKPEDK